MDCVGSAGGDRFGGAAVFDWAADVASFLGDAGGVLTSANVCGFFDVSFAGGLFWGDRPLSLYTAVWFRTRPAPLRPSSTAAAGVAASVGAATAVFLFLVAADFFPFAAAAALSATALSAAALSAAA